VYISRSLVLTLSPWNFNGRSVKRPNLAHNFFDGSTEGGNLVPLPAFSCCSNCVKTFLYVNNLEVVFVMLWLKYARYSSYMDGMELRIFCVDGRTKLKWIQGKSSVKVWTGLEWLRAASIVEASVTEKQEVSLLVPVTCEVVHVLVTNTSSHIARPCPRISYTGLGTEPKLLLTLKPHRACSIYLEVWNVNKRRLPTTSNSDII
jgi:hypothetical protein